MAINLQELEELIPGVCLHQDYFITAIKANADVGLGEFPLDKKHVTLSREIKTVLGLMYLIFYKDVCIGRLLDCNFQLKVRHKLHHSCIFNVDTSYNGEIYTDSFLTVHCHNTSVIVTLAPNIALDGDSARLEVEE
jgi:hypothetical protein